MGKEPLCVYAQAAKLKVRTIDMKNVVTVTRQSPGIFMFKDNTKRMIEKEVYLLDALDGMSEIFLMKTEHCEFNVELLDIKFRPYFRIKSNGLEYTVAERTLPVAGMNNFRDMGGYESIEGKTVKWGMLYRSDHIHNATEEGLKYLNQLGIRTIIDYRSPDEVSKYPNRLLDGDVVSYNLDPEAHTAELSAQFSSTKDNEDANLVRKIIAQKQSGMLVNQYDIVMEQYHNFVNGTKARQVFGKMLAIASDAAAAPMVQHCRGGKDRTGFGTILLLGILGVKTSDLVADYMLTHSNRLERNREKMEGYKKLTNDRDVLDYLYSLIDTKPEFIEASIREIERKYENITEFAKRELKISDEVIRTLKELYLR